MKNTNKKIIQKSVANDKIICYNIYCQKNRTNVCYIGGVFMKSQWVLVVMKKGNRNCEALWFEHENEAKDFIVQKYRESIKKAPFYDFENSYISDEHTYAKVTSGLSSIKLMLCKNIRHYK